MMKKSLLPCLFVSLALTSLPKTYAAEAPSLAASKGWVVILAAESQGSAGPLYNASQNDAISDYNFSVSKLGASTDHIILLAEGPLIDQFAAQGLYSPIDPLPGEDLPMKAAWFDRQDAQAQDNAAALTAVFGKTGFLHRGNGPADGAAGAAPAAITGLPLRGEPTAANFRAALKLVAGLAEKGQFVTLFVSASAAKSPEFLALTKPVPGGANERGLKAADFRLPDCKANVRILFIDASNTGEEKLCGSEAEEKSAAKRAAQDTGCFDLRKYLAPENETALVFSAAGSQAGSHRYFDNGKFWDEGRFAYELTRVSDDSWPQDSPAAFLDKISENAFLAGSPQNPRLYAADAARKTGIEPLLDSTDAAGEIVRPVEAAPQSGAVIITPGQVGFALKSNPTTLTTTREKLGVVTLTDYRGRVHNYGYLTPIRKSGPRSSSAKPEDRMSSTERAEKICNRIKALIERGKIQPADLFPGIDAATGLWVVKCPLIPEGHIITADPEFVHHRGSKNSEALAVTLCHQLYSALTDAKALNQLTGTPTDLYQSAIEAADKANWSEAAGLFQAALRKSPTYTNAYLALCNVQIRMGKRDEARRALQNLLDRGLPLAGEQRDQAASLRQQLK